MSKVRPAYGEAIDLERSSLSVEVQLWAERLLTGERRRSAKAEFVMVAVDEDGRPRRFVGV